MALGGGTFVTQNKVLPGAYINFVSVKSANANLSDRGIATMPLELDWGVDDAIFEVTNEELEKNSLKIFGYDYTHEKLKGLRDLFKNIKLLYCYKLTSGGVKASNALATAKYCGVRGNALRIIIRTNIDNGSKFDVITMLDDIVVDTQTVGDKAELVSNYYVDFKPDLTLSANAGVSLTGGTNGTVNGSSHQKYLEKIEAYSFNAMGVLTLEDAVKTLYVSFCKRLRDEVGSKFQLVAYNKPADYLGVVNVKNRVIDDVESSIVYFVTGLIAGCAVNKSNLNKVYNGEFKIDTDYSQSQLIECINSGEFVLHKVGQDVRVLEEEQADVFKDNQTIRVIDQIANDTAVLFNTKYLGEIPNDDAGRMSFWADVVKHHEELQRIRAIEKFSDADITVTQGDTKRSVVVSDAVTVINTMAKLYMTVKVA